MQNLLNLLDKHNISYCIKKKTELKKYIKNNKFLYIINDNIIVFSDIFQHKNLLCDFNILDQSSKSKLFINWLELNQTHVKFVNNEIKITITMYYDNKFKKDAFKMIENYNMEFKYVCISTNFPFLKSISNLKFSKLICNSEQLIYINRSLEISKLRFGINSDYDVKTSFKSFHQNDGRNIFQMFRHHYHSLDFVNILNNLKISYVIFDNLPALPVLRSLIDDSHSSLDIAINKFS